MFVYCLNSPVIYSDNDGLCAHTAYAPWMGDCSDCILYDVPLYDQNGWKLCWAFSQTMIEHYRAGIEATMEQAERRALTLAMNYKNKDGLWDKGGMPTDATNAITVTSEFTICDLANLLQNYGPLYAYYKRNDGAGAHMVVITGVNLRDDIVYTNNPWFINGEQYYYDFLTEFAGAYRKMVIN